MYNKNWEPQHGGRVISGITVKPSPRLTHEKWNKIIVTLQEWKIYYNKLQHMISSCP